MTKGRWRVGGARSTTHATDLAGNSASNQFNVTLDYASDHTPPVLSVVWPPDGTSISGNQFTLEGQVDDPTADISAVIVDAGGNTNQVTGLVERNGQVWAGDLPLAAGANTLTLTATDAAGNATTTSLTLYQSSLLVTISPLMGDQLNRSSVTVFGTVSDATASVYVNGILATVDEDGNWEADGVPVSPTGAAVLVVKAYGQSSAQVARAKLVSAYGVKTLSTAEGQGEKIARQAQPAIVRLSSYVLTAHGDSDGGGYPWQYDYSDNWLFGVGGSWISSGSGVFHDGTVYPYEPWSQYLSGSYGVEEANIFGPPWESAAWSGAVTAPSGYLINMQRSVQSQVVIVPAGRTTSDKLNFYLVRACALAYDYESSWMYDPSEGLPLPPEWLTIGNQTLVNTGETNSDGSCWGTTIIAAPAEAIVSVTPNATQFYGLNEFTFNIQVANATLQLGVDANRDGSITFDAGDQTSAAKPFRFWINDDTDTGDVASGGSDGGSDLPGRTSGANYADVQVNGRCDVLDFFPVALQMSNTLAWLPVTNGFEYHLSQADSAVNFVYSTNTLDMAFDYLTNPTNTTGYGSAWGKGAFEADTIQVTRSGVVLDTNWLGMVQTNGGQGFILVEGRAATDKPLLLEIWHQDSSGVLKKLGDVPLYLKISPVEEMYRWVGLRSAIGSPETKPTNLSEPANNPDAENMKGNFVFVHGYNVTEVKAQAWNAEVFKRLYQSHSHAKFYAVDWNGDESYLSSSDTTPDYHTNAVNAFRTASYLKGFLAGLNGETTLAGHSLGNMVCLSAISDSGAQPARYFMIDAAVPMEAIDGSLDTASSMVHPDWTDYDSRLYASKWHDLWASSDHRSELAWNDRLSNFGSTAVYNFYSSGEEVLREDPTPPPSGMLDAVYQNVLNYYTGRAGFYTWAWQEKLKGRCAFNGVCGSDHGGWGFNLANSSGYARFVNGLRVPIAPEVAAAVPSEQLQTNAFVDWGNYTFSSHPDFVNLPWSNGSNYAQSNRNHILSDAIPALTLPIGANHVDAITPDGQLDHNFDMQALYENSWPVGRGNPQYPVGTTAFGEWHHSDIKNIAYPYNYKFFNQIVYLGNLK